MTFKFQNGLESLDGVPKPFHALFTEGDDGKFNLIEGMEEYAGCSVEDVTGLRTALQTERQSHRSAKRELAEAKADLEAAEAGGGKPKAKPEEIATLEDRVNKAEAERDDFRTKFVNTKKKQIADAAILGDHKDNPITVLRAPVLDALGHEFDDDGNLSIFVKSDSGGRRITTKNGETGDMQALEYVSTVLRNQPDLKTIFPSKEKGGSGANGGDGEGGNGGTPDENPWLTGNLTQQALLRRDNPRKAEQLKKEAKRAKQKV